MPKKVDISGELLFNLYERKKLSTFRIAEKIGCCQATIWKKLIQYKIKTRLPGIKRINLTKEKLQNLYLNNKLSTWKIEKKLHIPRGTIYRKLKEFGIETRDRSTANIIYPKIDFSGDLIEKAYLIGFRIGDLGVRKQYPNSRTICVATGSTIKEQIELVNNLFKKYGKVWIKKTKYNKINAQIFLNESFDFLLNKSIPYKLLKNKKTFLAFLAGFTDAEGNIGINHDRAIYQLGNYNKKILIFIKNKLKKYDISINGPYESKNKGTYNKQGYIYNNNYNQIATVKKDNLLKLLNNLKPYIKHERKVRDLNLAIANINQRNKKFQ